MKILKPGKVEQRKFACPRCGCSFVASEYETEQLSTNGMDYSFCPACNRPRSWLTGEPYEEPMQDADAIERLADLIYDGCTTDGETAWEIAKHLTENGVTFREGMRL